MHRTVRELETTMSHRELMDWLRFEATTSPLPDRMLDLHFGVVSSLIVNAARSADSQPVVPSDFLIIRDRPAPAEQQQDGGLAESDRLRAIWQGG